MGLRSLLLLPGVLPKLSRCLCTQTTQALPIRSRKGKSHKTEVKEFIDVKRVRAVAGKGGDGEVSFLQLWANETAGPDGGDGGNGGHVIIQASTNVRDLYRVESVLKAEDGEKGHNKDCHGKSAHHNIIKVPVGTIVKDQDGKLIGDLEEDGAMFILARGGAGGHGNHFYATATEQSPRVAQYGALGEDLTYQLEIRSIAHFGLVGFPNAGKSTILQAISRARPKVAPYPFTTLKPHLGIIPFTDYSHISVADLPGIIEDSHRNRGLGVDFLRHIERCSVLILVVDISDSDATQHISILRKELRLFSQQLAAKPQVILANKIDLPEAQENLEALKETLPGEEILPISAKYGKNISAFLSTLKQLYDKYINVDNRSEV